MTMSLFSDRSNRKRTILRTFVHRDTEYTIKVPCYTIELYQDGTCGSKRRSQIGQGGVLEGIGRNNI